MEINFYSKRRSLIRGIKTAAFLTAGFLFSNQASAQMSGNYTIDKTGSATATNFKSFDAAMDALRGVTRSDGGPSLGGGVNGPVNITVATGTGPYTEEFRIYQITGASSTNRITFDGNGEELRRSGSSSSRHVVWFSGGDYFTLKDLYIKTTNSTYGWGIRFSGNSDWNIVENCTVDVTSVTSTSSYNSIGITFTNNASYSFGSSARSSGSTYNGRNNIIRDNEIFGSTNRNNMYAGIGHAGNSSNAYYNGYNNRFENNYIHNYYVYGIYGYYAGGAEFIGNRIVRGQKSSYTTHYGVYNYYGSKVTYIGNYIADDAPGNQTFTNYGVYDYYGTSSSAGYRIFNNNVINLQNGRYIRAAYLLWYYNQGQEARHNTIHIRGGSSHYYSYGLYMYSYVYQNAYVQNNIVDIDFTNYSGTIYSMYLYLYQGVVDNNVIPRKNVSNHKTGYYYGATYTTFAQWQAGNYSPDANGTDVRPNYQDNSAGYSNLSPISVEIDGIGVGVGITEDINGNPRHATYPDPGAYEFDVPLNVSSITFPTAICQGSTDDVAVTISNNAAFDVNGFKLEYSIDGKVISTEDYQGTIGAGQSAQYTFALPVTSDVTGSFVLTANVRGKAPVTQVNYTVNPAPVGSYISKGATFNGAFNSGDAQDPDIVAYGDQIDHVIEPPTGYTSAQFGTDWTFDSWEMVTPNGTSAGAQYSKNNPAGGNNGFNSFTPVIGQSDSTYIVRYAIRSLSNGCIAPTVERQIFVAPRPVAAFTNSVTCEGDAVQFDNNSTLSSGTVEYSWDFGDGNSTDLINPAHTYPSYGTYNVTLTATTNYGYTDVANVTITVVENPTAEFGATNVCEGNATPFVDGSIIPAGTPTYEWDFGDGSATGTGANPTHQYAALGVYEVTMTVTANGCSDEVTNYVTYAPNPVAAFTPSAVVCNSDDVEFTNQSNIASGNVGYSWDFGDMTSSTEMEPSHEYDIFGTIDVTLTVTSDFGCTDVITQQLNLTEAPKVDFTSNLLCDKDDVDFTNTSTEPSGATTTYEWKFSDGASYTSKDVTRSFPSIGTYEVTLLAFADNGCQDETIVEISVDENPVAEFYSEAVCEGTNTELMNASTGNNMNFTNNWDFGATGTSTDANPTAVFPVGTTNVTLTISTPSGCESTVTKTVEVYENPTVSNIELTSGQKGDGSINLTAQVTPAGAEYAIFWGDGAPTIANATGNDIAEQHTYVIDGLFNVSVRVSNMGCNIEDEGQVNVLRTGIINMSNGQLNVYPNPSNGVFNLDLSGLNTQNTQIEVYAANGQQVNSNVVINGNAAQLDLTGATPGVYLVKVVTESGVYNARITLNK